MFDPKISAFAAAVAFIVSFLVGVVSGAAFVAVLLRAVAFAAAFFALSALAYALVSRFLPELLETASVGGGLSSDEGGVVGRRVDVSVGDDQESDYGREGEPPDVASAAHAETVSADGFETGTETEGVEVEELASVTDALGADAATGNDGSSGMDQGAEEGYTGQGDGSPSSGAAPALPTGMLDDVDALPDLEGLTDSFVSPIADEEEELHSSPPAGGGRQGRNPGNSAGSFDAREMASAIQTILKRDQKG